MLLNPSPTSYRLIDHHAFFTHSTKRPPMLCASIIKSAPSSICSDATWWSLFIMLFTSTFWCVVCPPIRLPNSACTDATVRNEVWLIATSVGWINMSLSVARPRPVTCCLIMLTQLRCTVFLSSWLPHCLSPSLDYFCQNLPKVSVDMTTPPTCCPLLALFVRTPFCLRFSLLHPDSVPCAWLVTIPLEAALHQVFRVLA